MAWYSLLNPLSPILDRLDRIEAKVNSVLWYAEKGDFIMSETQEKIDALEGTIDTLVGKVGEITAKLGEILTGIGEAKDDPAELQALIDKGTAMIASIDAALAAAQPEPPTP